MTSPLRTIVIGLGHQSLDDHLPALNDSPMFDLIAVCDTDENKAFDIGNQYHVPAHKDLDELLDQFHGSIDVALVAVPHGSYFPIIKTLAENGIDIIKEKPFAVSFDETKKIKALVEKKQIGIRMTLQRRYNPIFQSFAQLKRRIGNVHAIEARYVMNIGKLDKDWRGSSLSAGGGALIDLGYHYVDLIVWYFGLPDTVMCNLGFDGREGQNYDVEDTAYVQFTYNRKANSDSNINGNLTVSRVHIQKEEAFTALGTRGHVTVKRGMVTRVFGPEEHDKEVLERHGAWPSALIDQLEHCAEELKSGTCRGQIDDEYLKHMAFIEACYHSAKSEKPARPEKFFKELTEGGKK